MQNYVQPGKTLTLTAPYTRTSGQGAKVGAIFGVAANDVTSGAVGEFVTEGVFDLAKGIGLNFAVGDRVYWDDVEKNCSDTDSSNSYSIGVAVAVAGNAATTVRVKLWASPVV